MALPVTTTAINYPVKKYVECIINFGSIYLNGGFTLTAKQVGLASFSRFNIPSVLGVVFRSTPSADGTTANIRFYETGSITPAGSNSVSNLLTVVDEVVSISAGAGTLAFVPANIQNIYATAGSVTGNKSIIPVGTSPATTQVAVNMTTGAMAFNTGTDAVTSVKVTYNKQVGSVTAQTFTGSQTAQAALAETSAETDISGLDGLVLAQIWGY